MADRPFLWVSLNPLAGSRAVEGSDEAALAPEPFDAHHHWSGSSRSIWSTSLSAPGELEEVERGRRETVVLSDR